MGVVISGVEGLKTTFANIAEKSSRGTREALQKGAKDVAELARRQAPIDRGNLEEAIKVGLEKDGHFRGRKVVSVYVDENMPAPTEEQPEKTVGDYAMEMHEFLYPESPYKLGDLSRMKQQQNPDVLVGGKFLERALQSLETEIQIEAESRLLQGIGH